MSLSLVITIPIVIMCSLFLASSPLTLGLWILALALMTALSIAAISTSWFGMITFLIYIGGMMVMFSYFTALSPNQHLNIWNMVKTSALTMLIMGPVISYSNSSLSLSSSTPTLSLMYMSQNMSLLMFLGATLFFALVAVVKISQQEEGPLRQFSL